jgi:hypothetical protein
MPPNPGNIYRRVKARFLTTRTVSTRISDSSWRRKVIASFPSWTFVSARDMIVLWGEAHPQPPLSELATVLTATHPATQCALSQGYLLRDKMGFLNLTFMWNDYRYSWASIMTGLRAERPRNRGSISGRAGGIFLIRRAQNWVWPPPSLL